MNNIFILTADHKKIQHFHNYYNIYNLETSTKINIIVDDRLLSNSKIEKIKKFYENVYYVSEVIKSTVPFLDNKEIALEILEKYGVSIKLLLFVYIGKILKIKQSMIMDDDTLLLKPIDDYFKYEYVIKREGLSTMSNIVKDFFKKIYDDIDDFNTKRLFINSGEIIYTWNDDLLLHHINEAFCSETLDFINEASKKSKNTNKIRTLSGRSWIIEQYIYGLFFYKIQSIKDVQLFKSDIKLYPNIMKEVPKTNTKIPNYIHYLPKDKEPFYEFYLQFLDNKIKEKNK